MFHFDAIASMPLKSLAIDIYMQNVYNIIMFYMFFSYFDEFLYYLNFLNIFKKIEKENKTISNRKTYNKIVFKFTNITISRSFVRQSR